MHHHSPARHSDSRQRENQLLPPTISRSCSRAFHSLSDRQRDGEIEKRQRRESSNANASQLSVLRFIIFHMTTMLPHQSHGQSSFRILQRASLLLWTVYAADTIVNASEPPVSLSVRRRTTGTTTTTATSPPKHRELQQDGFVRYDIPPFGLIFRSPNNLAGDAAAAADLLASTMLSPLKLTAEEFLLESFDIQLARADETGVRLPEMMRLLKSLDLNVTLQHEYSETVRERDQQQRLLQQQGDNWIGFYAEFVGMVKFVAPADPANKLTEDYVYGVMDDWMNGAFDEDHQVFKDMLKESYVPAVANLQSLDILMDIVIGSNPFGLAAPGQAQDNTDVRNGGDKALIAIFVIVGTATLVAAALYMRPTGKLSDTDGAFPIAETLPGRHGEAMDVLEASDRYLSQHRPDLFDAMRQRTDKKSKNSPKTSQSLASQDGVELDHSETSQGSGSNSSGDFAGSMWSKLAATLRRSGSSFPRYGENLACEEDPRDYPFAFNDFPRHDGTPCLIYSEDENGSATLRRGDSTMEPPSLRRRTPLSDEEYQMALSQQNSSMEEAYPLDESIEVEFTEKLERLVAMRHRHYEKESILEKHREIRRRERQQAEAYERQLRLRRHEMELDLSEIEASVSPQNSRSQKAWQQDNAISAPKHRSTSSNPDLFSSTSKVFDEALADSQGSANIAAASQQQYQQQYDPTTDKVDIQLLSPVDTTSLPPMGPKGPSPNSVAEQLPETDHPKPARKNKRHLSHRRSFSHGNAFEEKSPDGSNDSREDSNEEALLTFGIAAYTQFI